MAHQKLDQCDLHQGVKIVRGRDE